MALRAFQSNPAIGGFGGEGSQLDYINTLESKNNDRVTKKASQNKEQTSSAGSNNGAIQDHSSYSSQIDVESCDAFAQIVKELVDNAVDACARENDNIGKENEQADASSTSPPVPSKRVRVEIKPTQISTGNENDGADNAETIPCLRVKVSDNGCGMEDVDSCVSAFRSSKNGANIDDDDRDGKNSSQQHQPNKDGKPKANGTQSKSRLKQKNNGSSANNKHNASSSSSSFASGRYGVGLTLCLLHAQRLVPNSVTLIITSTKSSDFWIIRRYKADTQKDEIVCLKEERLPKIDKEECGTIVEVLVPGGQRAINAWPRLAEYFARFQLSIDLPCSIEVKAETLQPLPLYIRPPKEIVGRKIHEKRRKPLAVDVLMNSTIDSDVDDGDGAGEIADNGDEGEDWGDGFGDDNIEEAVDNVELQRASKSSLERLRLEDEKKKKVSLMQKAASLYKGRVDLRDTNVAYSTQRIRYRNESRKSSSTETAHSPVLEMSMVVFGTHATVSNDDDSVHSDNDGSFDKTAKLQVVRMVNGIPVLDSSEALACGVMTKISRSTVLWNSFGLDISDRSQLTSKTPSFGISDSSQVAPFLRTSTHSLYSCQNQDDAHSSSDDDDLDLEDIHNKRKRKKEQQARCILPAAQRLGDVLIVVQIRAKPSDLPLPTLSKGRLPMNDKSINDALENAMADCLRNLQVKNPSLLLTAHQLKKIERDVKYAPLVSGALASVIGRSKKQGLFQNTVSLVSRWDDKVKALGVSLDRNSICPRQRKERCQNTSIADDERTRSLVLGPMIERRIRFVVSSEFKCHQKAEEMEYKRQQREEMAAERKRAKASEEAAETDGLNSDAFCSDEDSVCNIAGEANDRAENARGENEGYCFSDGFQSDCASSNDGCVTAIVHKEKDTEASDDDSWSSEFGERIDGSFFR